MKDDLQIFLNGNEMLQRVLSWTLKRDVFSGCGSFEADLDPTLMFSVTCEPVKFEVHINGEPYMVGWIDSANRSYSKSSGRAFRISGRDTVQLWTDNSVLKIKSYSGTVESVIKSILSDSKSITGKNGNCKGKTYTLPDEFSAYTVTSRAKNNLPTKNVQVLTEANQTVFECISRIVSQHDIIIYSDGSGSIVIDGLIGSAEARATEWAGTVIYASSAVGDNRHQSNVISASYSESAAEFHNVLRVRGHTSSYLESLDEDNYSQRSIVVGSVSDNAEDEYKGLTKIKLLELNYTEEQAWAAKGNATAMVQAARINEFRKAFKFNYTVGGLSEDDGTPYNINQVVSVTDEIFGSGAPTFISYGLTMTGSKSTGMMTEFDLSCPGDAKPFSDEYKVGA